jgi:hypothetical protein
MPPSRKEIDDLHRKIVGLVRETNRAILGEDIIKEQDLWRLDIGHGPYRVNIYHPFNQRWMDIILSLKFDLNPTQRDVLASIYSNPSERFKFDHRLRSNLTSPYTFYSINYDKTPDKPDIPNVITVGSKLFPFDNSFSVHQLQNAIQSVVSI